MEFRTGEGFVIWTPLEPQDVLAPSAPDRCDQYAPGFLIPSTGREDLEALAAIDLDRLRLLDLQHVSSLESTT